MRYFGNYFGRYFGRLFGGRKAARYRLAAGLVYTAHAAAGRVAVSSAVEGRITQPEQ